MCGKESRKHGYAILVGAPTLYLAGRIVRLGRDCTHVPWLLNFFFFFPTRPQMVRFGPKQSKIGSNLGQNTYKKNVNFKINFYLVVVSNFWYCILIYEYHVMVMYLFYYLLLLVNWYIYIYIYHYMKKVFSFQQYIENKNKNIFNN